MSEIRGTDLLDQLAPRPRRLLERCGNLAAGRGETAWLVGGTVRDLVLGRPADDLDVVVEGEGMALAQSLARDVEARLTRHHAFQTARLDVPPEDEHDDREPTTGGPAPTASLDETPAGWVRIDVATARREEYRSPGELPRVVPGSLRDDLERRDFTINTLALGLNPDRLGQLIDPFDGLDALAAGRIEVMHSRSFADDPTRILRALRFAVRFGYALEERTGKWLGEAINGGYLDRVSGDRVRRELRYLLEEEPVRGPLRLANHGVLASLEAGLEAPGEVLDALERTRAWHREACGPEADELGAPGWSLVLASCGRPLTNQQRWRLARRLALTRDERRPLVETGASWRQVRDSWRRAPGPARPSCVVARLRPLSTGALLVVLAFLEADGDTDLVDELRRYLVELRHVHPRLDGADLLELGVREGPRVGEFLERLRAARLDGVVESRADEERRVRAWLEQGE